MGQVAFAGNVYDTELILRAQRAGLRIVELPVEIVETRRSSWGVLRRIPRTVFDLILLRAMLWKETRRAS
jgi:hypothetical protein